MPTDTELLNHLIDTADDVIVYLRLPGRSAKDSAWVNSARYEVNPGVDRRKLVRAVLSAEITKVEGGWCKA